MRAINYLPIITDSTKQAFFDYINAINIPQIDYFAIGIQHIATKKSISIMSSLEWQNQFITNNYVDFDPLRKATLHTKRTIIPFVEIDFIDNFGKEIMQQRAKMGIGNGIILMERFPKYNYMITLGTGFKKFDAYDFLKQYHDKIAFVKSDLIGLVAVDSEIFLGDLLLTHPSSDAK